MGTRLTVHHYNESFRSFRNARLFCRTSTYQSSRLFVL